jgi:predicted nucleic acid-binding protein
MSDKIFVDTNILMYAHDRSAGHKHKRAEVVLEELWETRQGVLSMQVLQELCVNLRRRTHPPLSAEKTRRLIEDYFRWEVVIPEPEFVLQAMDIETQYKISFWDALIIHSAESCGATVLYSEDLSNGQNYGSVRVMNPLLNRS